MQRCVLGVVVGLLLAGGAGEAAGQRRRGGEEPRGLREPIQEFLLAETVYPQEAGQVQLTLDSRRLPELGTRLHAEYGLTDHFQLAVNTPYYTDGNPGSHGWGGEALYGFMPAGSPFAFAAQLEVSRTHELSGAGEGDARRTVEWEPGVVVGTELGPLQLHGAVGLGITSDASELDHSLGAMFDAGPFVPTLELTGAQSDAEHTLLLTPGLFFKPTSQLQAGFGVPVSLRSGSERPRWVLQVTAEF